MPEADTGQTPTVLLTGATGFLGSHLGYGLLEKGCRVIALARPSRAAGARERVLEAICRVPDSDAGLPELLQRLEVVEGDVTRERLGLEAPALDRLATRIDEVWHSAASLSFLDEDREAIFEMNVGGTERILALVERSRGRSLHHVSTAYVAGDRTGAVTEDELDAGQGFKNPYEESKCRAELRVREAERGGALTARIYRPSIVIGESRTGRATHFHGVYAFIRGLWAVAERLRRRSGGDGSVSLPLRVRGSESTTLNFVPIDYVTDGMIEIGARKSSAGGTFHLANPQATENGLWLGIVCDQLRIEGIRLVEEGAFETEPMTRLEAVFHRQMAFYHPYLGGEPAFDCSRALESLAGAGIECPRVTPDFARKMTGWYIDRLYRQADPSPDA